MNGSEDISNKTSLELLELFLSNVEYEKGMVKRYNQTLSISNGMIETKEFPIWVDGIDLLGYCMDESSRIEGIYDGNMPAGDVRREAKKIASSLKNTPLDYVFYLKLPDGLEFENDLIISDQIKIFKADTLIVDSISTANINTYRRREFNLKAAVFQEGVEIKPEFTNLEVGSTYLAIKTKGLVSRLSTITESIDPLHVYKIFIAFLNIENLLHYGSMLQEILSRNGEADHGKEALVYKDNYQFVTEIDRPKDEYAFVSRLVFSAEAKQKDALVLELNKFSMLIMKMNNVYLDQERNKIINSLYWYFESTRSANGAFKTMLDVSMIDSFFTLNDKKEDKFKQIILEKNPTSKPNKNSDEWKSLSNLYDRRNEIAHGKVHLLEVDSKNKANKHINIINDGNIRSLYKALIKSKIEKLLTN